MYHTIDINVQRNWIESIDKKTPVVKSICSIIISNNIDAKEKWDIEFQGVIKYEFFIYLLILQYIFHGNFQFPAIYQLFRFHKIDVLLIKHHKAYFRNTVEGRGFANVKLVKALFDNFLYLCKKNVLAEIETVGKGMTKIGERINDAPVKIYKTYVLTEQFAVHLSAICFTTGKRHYLIDVYPWYNQDFANRRKAITKHLVSNIPYYINKSIKEGIQKIVEEKNPSVISDFLKREGRRIEYYQGNKLNEFYIDIENAVKEYNDLLEIIESDFHGEHSFISGHNHPIYYHIIQDSRGRIYYSGQPVSFISRNLHRYALDLFPNRWLLNKKYSILLDYLIIATISWIVRGPLQLVFENELTLENYDKIIDEFYEMFPTYDMFSSYIILKGIKKEKFASGFYLYHVGIITKEIVDCTSSGFQHFSVLVQNEELIKDCLVLPGGKNRDIYSSVGKYLENRKLLKKYLDYFEPRGICKKPVIVLIYRAGAVTIRNYLWDSIDLVKFSNDYNVKSKILIKLVKLPKFNLAQILKVIKSWEKEEFSTDEKIKMFEELCEKEIEKILKNINKNNLDEENIFSTPNENQTDEEIISEESNELLFEAEKITKSKKDKNHLKKIEQNKKKIIEKWKAPIPICKEKEIIGYIEFITFILNLSKEFSKGLKVKLGPVIDAQKELRRFARKYRSESHSFSLQEGTFSSHYYIKFPIKIKFGQYKKENFIRDTTFIGINRVPDKAKISNRYVVNIIHICDANLIKLVVRDSIRKIIPFACLHDALLIPIGIEEEIKERFRKNMTEIYKVNPINKICLSDKALSGKSKQYKSDLQKCWRTIQNRNEQKWIIPNTAENAFKATIITEEVKETVKLICINRKIRHDKLIIEVKKLYAIIYRQNIHTTQQLEDTKKIILERNKVLEDLTSIELSDLEFQEENTKITD